jgi:anti-sigma regulatory factor (Ser/Thr protein kinase)
MALATCLQLNLPPDPASVRRARAAVGDAVAELSDEERLADDVRLCVSEAVTNVVRHAYSGRSRAEVEVVVTHEDDELHVTVRDTGVGLRRSGRAARAGGFGMRIMEKLASSLAITTSPRTGTEVRMVFELD